MALGNKEAPVKKAAIAHEDALADKEALGEKVLAVLIVQWWLVLKPLKTRRRLVQKIICSNLLMREY